MTGLPVRCEQLRQLYQVDGEQVVALLDTGEATLKRYYKEGHRIRLQPANSAMEPRIIEADRCRIQVIVQMPNEADPGTAAAAAAGAENHDACRPDSSP